MTVIRRKRKIWEIGIKNKIPYLKKVDNKEKKDEKSLQEIIEETEHILRERKELAPEDPTQEKPSFTDPLADLDGIYWHVLAELPSYLRKRFLPPEYIDESIGDIVEKAVRHDYKEGAPSWLPFKVGDKVRTTKEHDGMFGQKTALKGEITHLETKESGGNTIVTILMNGRIYAISAYWIEKIPPSEFKQKTGE